MNLKRMSLSLAIALALGASTSYTLAADSSATTAKATTATVTASTDTDEASASAEKAKEAAYAKAKTTTTAESSTSTSSQTLADGYTDIEKHWAKDDIMAMSRLGYINGYSYNTFLPDATITREQIASIYDKIITKKASEKELATIKAKAEKVEYGDVSTDRWSHQAIANVAAAGVMYGAKAGAFVPEHKMTRGEFAVTAALFAKEQGVKNAKTSIKVTFKDADKIPENIKPSVNQLAQEGFIASGASVPFRPSDALTRAEATSILYRIVENKPVDVSKTNAAIAKQAQKEETTKEEASKSTPEQTKLEDKVFEELDKTYQNSSRFLDYGVMYWQNDTLHVALKKAKDIPTVKANLAARGDSAIDKGVVVEQTQYSQAEYDIIEKNFRKQYKTAEPQGTIYTVFPDVPNNQLVAVVSVASKATQTALTKSFGKKVKTLVK